MRYYVVDAFAEHIFEGNPAGVCVMDEWISVETMEKIAIENNLSETAFTVKEGDGYRLRWFTPGGEIDLCGHATLATAYILMRFVETDKNTIVFHTMKNELSVTKKGCMYEMDFPTITPHKYHATDEMIEALGAVPMETYKSRDLIFIFDSEETVQNLSPDFAKMKEFPEGLAVFVTAKGKDFDFVSRAFWPKLNINEDPVTGAMYCCLVPYWKDRIGKTKMVSRQLSKRGGTVYCEYCGDRVKISGKAALYSIANICVDKEI